MSGGGTVDRWKDHAHSLKRELNALTIASRDPRTPWYAKVLAACVVAYAFSPIDLIPDPIPVLGYLDDLILIPLGIALVLHLIPDEVMTESRARAAANAGQPTNWIAAGLIVCCWIVLVAITVWLIWRYV
ncbi:MAG: YkvA family protein [Thermomicrobiales bacterium]